MKPTAVALLLAFAAASPAQAHHARPNHRRVVYPDSVTLDGKAYKVCQGGMQDDCVQPRQAGLGSRKMATGSYKPGHGKRAR